MPTARTRRATDAAASRSPRSDGTATRLQILDMAGRVYAEKGFHGTTSKEICERAGTNMAAVNYHFGGKEGLYEAVLIEAHRQIIGLNDLITISQTGKDPRAKLRAVLGQFIGVATRPSAPWGVRVIVQELMAPSPHARTLIKQAVLPKAKVVKELVAQILKLAPEHPAVQRSVAFVILPCAALVIAPRDLRARVVPAVDADPEALFEDLMRYVLAGLDGVARQHRAEQ